MAHNRIFAALMEKKVQEQEREVQRAYDKLTDASPSADESAIVRTFYWGSRNEFSCGVAHEVYDPHFRFPVLPQLLVTPRLIVNILPMPTSEFSYRYGVTPTQMRRLADEEFVVPNVYYFLLNGWQAYSKYRSLWPLLEHSSRQPALRHERATTSPTCAHVCPRIMRRSPARSATSSRHRLQPFSSTEINGQIDGVPVSAGTLTPSLHSVARIR